MGDLVNPSEDRRQGPFETKFDYENRIKRLDHQAAKMKELFDAMTPIKDIRKDSKCTAQNT